MTQKGNNNILNNLKVAHEKFTWSGKEIPHIGSYGGHKWHGFWLKDLDAREAFPLSTEFRLARKKDKGIIFLHVIPSFYLSFHGIATNDQY